MNPDEFMDDMANAAAPAVYKLLEKTGGDVESSYDVMIEGMIMGLKATPIEIRQKLIASILTHFNMNGEEI